MQHSSFRQLVQKGQPSVYQYVWEVSSQIVSYCGQVINDIFILTFLLEVAFDCKQKGFSCPCNIQQFCE